MSQDYLFFQDIDSDILFERNNHLIPSIKVRNIKEAINEFDRIMESFDKTEIPIAQILGLRNLSAFIGEVFNLAIARKSENLLIQNPHQDGYPGLLVMDKDGEATFNNLASRIKEKEPFSPFLQGGIEVKATCGDIKSAKWFSENNLIKCSLGDERVDFVTNYNWKAHHRETNNLMGLIWDFIDNKPRIVLISYSSNLSINDWGKTVVPKKNSRTTSVSIMNKDGISKMISGRICMLRKPSYRVKLERNIKKYI